ncbi:MAG: VWA domain-containing protein [Myxococcales bacterium]|nr:VWA domain-containing protein [Myxococcales bacterium]MBK7192136.1 VWA domain-containing protein [Myxococcales bacterium]MBP6846257.1 VWA domain-containing protein [Kofleriaceae bacterium]
MHKRALWTILVVFGVLAAAGCKKKVDDGGGSKGPPSSTPAPPTQPAVELRIAYGSEKKAWLEEQIKAWNATGPKTAGGAPIKAVGAASGSGEAMQAVLDGKSRPHVFSPASSAYVALLNQAWLSRDNHTKALAPAGEPIVLSPIVIAMWKPMAEALGWPGKDIGWADLVKLSRDPKGWATYERPEWGTFKLGHTHPEYSNSGLLAVLAAAYAGTGKTTGLTADDLTAPSTRAFLTEVEDSIVHYGKSTSLFIDKMVERGPTYLSAAVLYENLVIEANSKTPAPSPPLVAIYPVEGTFWSDHPYAILDAEWVGADERAAAQAFLAFVKARPAQERALALGFRPADPAIAMAAPIDAAHGADPQQPQTLLAVPDGATLAKLVAAWRATKKASEVTLVFDKSGSMEGQPLAEAKAGAATFLDTLDDRDRVTLVFFDDKVYPPIGPVELGPSRAMLRQRIEGTIASGGTALYDAVTEAHAAMRGKVAKNPHRIHAMVVMTDGVDENSVTTLPKVTKQVTVEGDAAVSIFTIAYGTETNPDALTQIAEKSRGTFSRGSVADIRAVFRDIGTFF